jgi:two-component system, NtrC family, sensor kinase
MKKKISGIVRNLFHPHDFLTVLGKDRYESLKLRIILLDAFLSLVPLVIVITISYFWFQKILKDDFSHQLKWEMENTTQSIEFFLSERLSGLRFISSSNTYEQLSDQKNLNDLFTRFKREFPGLVDIGVIGSDGIQRSYTGPYHLEGKDYSNQDWFNEVIIRSSYVSDVFMGYRKIPHFAIAVKKEIPEKRTFMVLRATIDMETLKKYASSINLRDNDDAFIVNREGILQTPSRFHGGVLEKFSERFSAPRENVEIKEMAKSDGICSMCGFAYIGNSPWVLVADIRSTPYGKIPAIFKNELFFITLISVILGITVTIFMSQTVVNHIRKSDLEREEAIANTEHASKLATVGRLAAGVAHEINNPLAIINEKAGLMKDILETSGDLQQHKEKFMALIGGIFDGVNRCRTITHRLLGFSRRMDISHDAIDINDVVKEVIGFLGKEIEYRDIRLELNLGKDLPNVVTDKGQVQQVFLNIINNAIDAVDKGGLIGISSYVKDKQFVRVAIKDNGSGIAKDKLKHIFEPFYTTKGKEKGTGLGLSISYGIMQRLGGAILVESEINEGTTFFIEIPVRTEDT